jgi:hypothetical protein
MSITVRGFDSQVGCPVVAQTSVCGLTFAVRNVIERLKSVLLKTKKSRPRSLAERLSGELLGLTLGCDLRKEGVTVTLRKTIQTTDLIPEVRSQPPHCD